jgi:hypothetical protein
MKNKCLFLLIAAMTFIVCGCESIPKAAKAYMKGPHPEPFVQESTTHKSPNFGLKVAGKW